MKKLVLFAFVGLVSVSAQAKLSIAEREVADKQKVAIDKDLAKIKQTCGCAMTVDVDWEKVLTSTDKPEYRPKVMEATAACIGKLHSDLEGASGLCTKHKKEICESIKKIAITYDDKGADGYGGATIDAKSKTLTVKVGEGGNGCRMVNFSGDLSKAL